MYAFEKGQAVRILCDRSPHGPRAGSTGVVFARRSIFRDEHDKAVNEYLILFDARLWNFEEDMMEAI